jgi:WD40 repeat protein
VSSARHAFTQRPATNFPPVHENQLQDSSILFQKRQIDIPEIDKKIADFLPQNAALELRLVSRRLKKNLDSCDSKNRIGGFRRCFKEHLKHSAILCSSSQFIAHIHNNHDGTIKIYNLKTEAELNTSLNNKSGSSYTTFTFDTKFFVFAATLGFQSSVRVWNVATGMETTRLPKGVICLIKSSNKILICNHANPEMYGVYDLESGIKIQNLEIGYSGFITFAETISNNRLVTFSQDERIRVWDLTTGGVLCSFPWNNLLPPISFQITSDETCIVICSKNGFAEVIKLDTGKTLHILTANTDGHVTSVFLADSKVVLTFCNADPRIKLWNLSTGEELFNFIEHKRPIVSVVKTSDERIVSCSEDGMIKIWNWKTEKVLHTIAEKGAEILNALITSDDLLIVRSNDDNQEILATWNLKKKPLGID